MQNGGASVGIAAAPVEQGFVESVKGSTGMIRILDREARLFFNARSLHAPKAWGSFAARIGAEVEFTRGFDPETRRESAIGVKLLPVGAVLGEEKPLPGGV